MSVTPPSPFAALLRRSKFASYDPHIGQVYTAHGGHAHRGNWGLKRPLPNRRRVGFITVRSVDSPEQQTEWNSAESSARWMRRWEQLGKKLVIEEMGNWRIRPLTWSTDSEFDRAGKVGIEPGRERDREHKVLNPNTLIPDPEAMSPKQFQKYIERLRKIRPEFKEYLAGRYLKQQNEQQKQQPNTKAKASHKLNSEVKQQGILKLSGSGEIDMYASGQQAASMHVDDFLMRRAAEEFQSEESKRIERRPHNLAGLEYTFMSTMQSQYLHKPVPGRDVAQSRAERYDHSRREQKTDIIAVGGMLGELRDTGGQTIMPTDFGTLEEPRRNREQGRGTFVIKTADLYRVPSTVGHTPQKASDTKFSSIQFSTPELAKSNSSNPHPLGSIEYVGWRDTNQAFGDAALIPGQYNKFVKGARKYRHDTGPNGTGSGNELLGTLSGILNKRTGANH
jgi:Mitochondrial ribosomal protein subunit